MIEAKLRIDQNLMGKSQHVSPTRMELTDSQRNMQGMTSRIPMGLDNIKITKTQMTFVRQEQNDTDRQEAEREVAVFNPDVYEIDDLISKIESDFIHVSAKV